MMFKRNNILEKKWLKKFNFELQRQILHNEISYKACGNKLIISPIKKMDMILNLGSGYSMWSYDICKEYDVGCIVDIDINEFNIYDYLEKDEIDNYSEVKILNINIDLKKGCINFKDNTIDFIYQRDMLSVYNDLEWKNIVKDIKRVLKKGAYVEFVEFNFIVNHNKSNKVVFSNLVNNYLIATFNRNNYIYKPDILIKILEEHFKTIKIKIVELPLYYSEDFKYFCIDDLIISYKYIEDEINKIYPQGFDKFIEEIKKEWIFNESYIELYIISVKK